MKVMFEIPQSKIKAVAALANMEGKLTDEQIDEIVNVPEVDITEAIKNSEEAQNVFMGFGMMAIGVIGEQKFPDL